MIEKLSSPQAYEGDYGPGSEMKNPKEVKKDEAGQGASLSINPDSEEATNSHMENSDSNQKNEKVSEALKMYDRLEDAIDFRRKVSIYALDPAFHERVKDIK